MERVSTLEKSGVSSTSVSVDNSKVELLEKKLSEMEQKFEKLTQELMSKDKEIVVAVNQNSSLATENNKKFNEDINSLKVKVNEITTHLNKIPVPPASVPPQQKQPVQQQVPPAQQHALGLPRSSRPGTCPRSTRNASESMAMDLPLPKNPDRPAQPLPASRARSSARRKTVQTSRPGAARTGEEPCAAAWHPDVADSTRDN